MRFSAKIKELQEDMDKTNKDRRDPTSNTVSTFKVHRYALASYETVKASNPRQKSKESKESGAAAAAQAPQQPEKQQANYEVWRHPRLGDVKPPISQAMFRKVASRKLTREVRVFASSPVWVRVVRCALIWRVT